MIKNNLTNERFGRLVALIYLEDKGRGTIWYCKCDCGKYHSSRYLKEGKTNSCGCYRSEVTSKRVRKHGYTKHPEFKIWKLMISRCYNKNDKAYKKYGAKGITVCDRWLSSFQIFFDDMGQRPSQKYSIDRINNKGNYEPTNCRWATKKEQVRNRDMTVMITYKGETKPLGEWAERLDIDYELLACRILARKWSIDKAFTKKSFNINTITYNGETRSISEWARILGMKKSVLHTRLSRGWSIERAITEAVHKK